MVITQIGTIRTPFKAREGTPIQPRMGRAIKGTVEILSEFGEALQDLDGFSHIILLYHLHLSEGYSLKVVPYLDSQERGLFATRAPKRPTAIGLSVVRLIGIVGNTLHIEDIDIIDGTPLIDIKPYVPAFDEATDIRVGWLESKLRDADDRRDDGRFDR